MATWLYRFIGSVSLLIGTLGLFVPLLPTTVFILIAAWSLARSNPALYQKLMEHRHFGEIIRNWQEHRAIPVKAKIAAVLSIFISTIISVAALKDMPVFAITLLVGMSLIVLYIVTRPSIARTSIRLDSPMT